MEFLNIAYLTRVNLASLNGSEGTGGNITQIKKISDNQGNEYAYVSGQALRRYLKETLLQLGENITAVDDKGEPSFTLIEKGEFRDLNSQIYNNNSTAFANPKLMYEQFSDLDLFGYMLPKGGRRWSPVKVSPLISIHPYKGQYDYLTRKKNAPDDARSGNIVQIEIDTLNFMRGNILVDADKIGFEINEYNYVATKMLEPEQIKKRRSALIDAIKYFNGGAKRARNLEDISPKFVIAINQITGNPFLLNALKVDKQDKLIIEPVLSALDDYKDCIKSISIGISNGILANEAEIKEKFKSYSVTSVSQALDSLKIK